MEGLCDKRTRFCNPREQGTVRGWVSVRETRRENGNRFTTAEKRPLVGRSIDAMRTPRYNDAPCAGQVAPERFSESDSLSTCCARANNAHRAIKRRKYSGDPKPRRARAHCIKLRRPPRIFGR